MKKNTYPWLLVLLAFCALPLACTKPMGPLAPSGVPTPVPTPDIHWDNAVITSYNGASVSFSMRLSVDGAPDPGAQVQIAGPGGTTSASNMGTVGMESLFVCWTPSCTPGQVLTLTTTTSGGAVASAALIMPGPVVIASDGSTASWTYEGNADSADVYYYQSGTSTFNSTNNSPDINSVFTFPASAYPAMGTQYTVAVWLKNLTTAITGADSTSSYSVVCYMTSTVSK